MDLLANDYPDVILAARAAPCLTLYQPTHRQHPENLQDPIRFGNLVKQLSQSLQKKYPQRDIDALLAPLHALAGDSKFWNHTLDGLAVLVAADFFRAYRLQRPVAELAVVAGSFHTKPLLRMMQSADRYQVLGINRHEARLFEGNRDRIDEIELAPDVPRTLADVLDRDAERERATRTHGPSNRRRWAATAPAMSSRMPSARIPNTSSAPSTAPCSNITPGPPGCRCCWRPSRNITTCSARSAAIRICWTQLLTSIRTI
jgi:hypothetical protein